MEMRAISIEDFGHIYNGRMVKDFPLSELKPLFDILALYERKVYICYGFYEQDTFVGYVNLCTLGYPGIFIDYFAVAPEWRGQGLGGKCLDMLRQRLSAKYDYIILEAEDPSYGRDSADIKRRWDRLRFYRNNNVRDMGLVVNCIGYDARILSIDMKQQPQPEEAMNTLLCCYNRFFGRRAVDEKISFHHSILEWPL